MINASSEKEAVKILLECGYNENIILSYQSQSEILLNDEQKNTIYTLKEFCADEHLLQYILLPYDYHNAQSIYKSKITDVTLFETLYPFGVSDPEKLKEYILQKNYNMLSKPMAEALDFLDQNQKKITAKEIDTTFKKALFQERTKYLNGIKNKHLLTYFKTEIDLTNLKTILKAIIYKLSREEAAEILIENGFLNRQDILMVYEKPPQEMKEYFLKTEYSSLSQIICETVETQNISAFEEAAHLYLLTLSAQNKDNLYSTSFLFHWFLLKQEEFKIIQLILTGKRYDISKKQLKEYLKDAYENFR